jgi:DegV family protein with EDD domain
VSPGPKTALVCDTTAYLPTGLVESRGINLISLYVTLAGGEQQRESDVGDYTDFYERLRLSDEGATTSQPSVGDFISVYEPLLAEGMEIASIHLSAAISGTCESAKQAKQTLSDDGRGGERIRVCDSRSGAGGMAIVVLAAAAAAARGADADETIARADETRNRMKMWFGLDTLEYLRRGGRIGAARAWIGSTLKIKPILTLEEEITPVERVRTHGRVFQRLIDYARQRHEDGCDGWVVQHTQDPESAARLADECRAIFGCEPLLVSEVGPVIGAHIGPGMLGVGAAPAELVE